MLTTIGDKIIEIRPKQIIESNAILDNDYLVLLNNPSRKRGRPKVVHDNEEIKNEEPTKQPSSDPKTKA